MWSLLYYNAGRLAFGSGWKLGECPYEALSQEWHSWRTGWLDGQDEARRKEEDVAF